MLTIMSPDLQKQYEHIDAYTMIQGLRRMFENQASAERYNISKALFTCKLAEGSPISPHVIKMMCYIETLDKLGCELKDDLATDVILQSLLVSYELATNMEKTVAELHGVLKIAEDNIKKNHNYVMMVQKEKKKRKCWTPPKDNGRKRFLMSHRALSLRQKVSLAKASTATRRVIGSRTVRSTWRSRRKREVRLSLYV
jgi:hypothetical protein